MREDMPPAERDHFLNNILNQNARQKQLIDKMLALIRVEKQQTLGVSARVRLSDLAAQVQADCGARMAARGLRLQIDVADIEVEGDELLLRQALDNLLDNAIDFSPAGATIVLRAEVREARAIISISDRGTGIPDYARERLFERFYSLPRPDGARSTGLGLPFVREAVALHGGSVSVQNGETGGAVARIELPLA
jgi:two-component system sensor histidine kinase CreC